MGKNIQSKPSNNQASLKIINKRCGYTYDYLRKSITGDRVSLLCDIAKTEYFKLSNESKKAIENLVNELETKK